MTEECLGYRYDGVPRVMQDDMALLYKRNPHHPFFLASLFDAFKMYVEQHHDGKLHWQYLHHDYTFWEVVDYWLHSFPDDLMKEAVDAWEEADKNKKAGVAAQ